MVQASRLPEELGETLPLECLLCARGVGKGGRCQDLNGNGRLGVPLRAG